MTILDFNRVSCSYKGSATWIRQQDQHTCQVQILPAIAGIGTFFSAKWQHWAFGLFIQEVLFNLTSSDEGKKFSHTQ